MRQYRHLMTIPFVLFVLFVLTLSGCGGGGGGSNDLDNDGIPNASDAAEQNPDVFADFTNINLAPLPGSSFSAAVDINDSGMVVGMSDETGGKVQAVAWSADGTLLPPLDAGVASFAAAYSVNNQGQIVGELEGTSLVFAATLWQSDTSPLASLPGLSANGRSAAYGINNIGIAVGEAADDLGMLNAIAWAIDATGVATGPVLMAAPVGATFSAAYYVNDNAQAVGEYGLGGGSNHAILWEIPATGPAVMTDLGAALDPAIFTNSVAYAINGFDLVVGEAEAVADGSLHAVRWDVSGITPVVIDLGELVGESNSLAINDDGRTAGYTAVTAGGNSSAAVWDARSTVATTSNSVTAGTAVFSQGYGLNSLGDVVGLADGQAFLAVSN